MLNREQQEELVAAYRGAKHKDRQIKILSECYLIPENYVRKILQDAGALVEGEPEKKRPGRPKGFSPKKAAAEDGPKDEKPEEPQPLPEPNVGPEKREEAPKEEKPARLGEAVERTKDALLESFGARTDLPEPPPADPELRRAEFDRMLEDALIRTKKEKEEAKQARAEAVSWTVPEIKALAFDVVMRLLQANADEDGVIASRPVAYAALALGHLVAALEADE